jgi:hypothetical protein
LRSFFDLRARLAVIRSNRCSTINSQLSAINSLQPE